MRQGKRETGKGKRETVGLGATAIPPYRHTALLADGPEFDKIRRIWRALGARGAGGGDDCAIVEFGAERLAISTDMALEGVHFQQGWLSPREIGWRAAAAGLSDLAAVAAEPRGVLVSLGVSAEWPDEFVGELMEGVAAVADSVGALVWGGDLVRSQRIVLDVVVFGSVSAPVGRGGAGPGDALWVTGRLGGPLAALEAWRAGREPDQSARERFALPRPRVSEGLWLRDRGARAMIDISDGLAADAGQLAAASGVRCVIVSDRVPRHAAAEAVETALLGGEEFELLVALPENGDPQLGQRFEGEFGLPLTPIGHIEAGTGVRVLSDGVPVELPQGFSHF